MHKKYLSGTVFFTSIDNAIFLLEHLLEDEVDDEEEWEKLAGIWK